jgi:hypothetical protein
LPLEQEPLKLQYDPLDAAVLGLPQAAVDQPEIARLNVESQELRRIAAASPDRHEADLWRGLA